MFHPDGLASLHSNESDNAPQKRDPRGIEGHIVPESFDAFFRSHDNADEIGHNASSQQLQHFKGPLDFASPMTNLCEDDAEKIESFNTHLIGHRKKTQPFAFPSRSFEVLRKHGCRSLKLDGKECSTPQPTHLSTEIIIQLASQKFIQSLHNDSHPYPTSILDVSEEDCKGVELVQNLLSCADKVGEQQYERAIKFLKECDKCSSPSGTPIQRLVFYFSEALFEKISRETGRITPKGFEKKCLEPSEIGMCPNITIAFQKEHPHSHITKFTGIQAIVDHLDPEARKIHVIDFEIRSGVQWIMLMETLAAAQKRHPIQQVKITAVGTNSKLMLMDIGKQLESFARSLDLKLVFKVVMVDNILDLKEDLFELDDDDEVVAVYAAYALMKMIGKVYELEHVMRMIRSINPCVMVMAEKEVNCNAPSFIGRFVESLFFFGAYFDSLGECMKDDERNRSKAESVWFRSSIRNVLVARGDERKIRHVDIKVWRAFFACFGMEEVELSTASLDQAKLVLHGFSCGTYCDLNMDGKCLIIGWKGTPLSSLSVWKFK